MPDSVNEAALPYNNYGNISTTGRYMLFVYCGFYPNGGTNDLIARSDDIDELRTLYNNVFSKLYEPHYNIFDLQENKTVEFDADQEVFLTEED
jgi:hypothetical protein